MLTKRELAVIMAYTDTVTLTGDDLKYLYDYLSKIAGRAVYTHEMSKIIDKYKETVIRNDFTEICKSTQEKSTVSKLLKGVKTMDNRIKYIADYYGFTSQADMLIEESAEFTQAICKLRRGSENEYTHIKEELADVLVCAEQLKYLLGTSDIENVMNAKLDRQLQRIEQEKQAEMNRIFP